jgi:hypothetical protein
VIIDEEAYLEHVGVKGMRWGVRRARRTERLVRGGTVGSGTASWLRATKRVGPVDLIRGGGVRGAAARKSMREIQRSKRIATGKASVKDQIVRVGSTRARDLVPVRESKASKDSRVFGNDKLVVAAAGALIVANMLGKQAVKRGKGFS